MGLCPSDARRDAAAGAQAGPLGRKALDELRRVLVEVMGEFAATWATWVVSVLTPAGTSFVSLLVSHTDRDYSAMAGVSRMHFTAGVFDVRRQSCQELLSGWRAEWFYCCLNKRP